MTSNEMQASKRLPARRTPDLPHVAHQIFVVRAAASRFLDRGRVAVDPGQTGRREKAER